MKSLNLKISFTILSFVYCLLTGNTQLSAQSNKESIDSENIELFRLAMVGSNFLQFDADTTIQMIQRLNVHYLCVKNKHLPMNSTDRLIADYKAKLANAGIVPVSVGLIYMNRKEEIDEAFEYAKRLGVELIIGTPKHELLPYIEQKVKEYNIKLAIHNHGGDIPLYPNADDIMKHIEGLDPRIGMCLDIGHDIRAGSNPIDDLKKYHNRIYDIHIKNVTAADKTGRTCEMDRGVIDIPAFVKMMRQVNYTGTCSLEFEKDKYAPLTGIAISIGYLRGVLDAVGD